jgi:hypothetical protein
MRYLQAFAAGSLDAAWDDLLFRPLDVPILNHLDTL